MNKMILDFSAKSENESFARTVAAAFVLTLDPTVEVLAEIKTAISEAVTNAIVHGYVNGGGTISMSGSIENDTVIFEISDKGVGIEDIEKAREPLYTSSPQTERSGMGFTIMESFMDDVKVKSKPGKGTTVTMTKKIEVPRNA